MVATPEAFLLLAIPSTTLSYQGAIESGVLNLECVTIQIPDASNPNVQRDVYLVLRLGSIETPIDPSRVIQRSHGSSSRIYTFQPTEFDPTTLTVTVSLPHPKDPNPTFMEDLETFETILNQYADLRNASIPGSGASAPSPTPNPAPQAIGNGTAIGSGFPGAHGDLRGHLVIVNQDNGQVLGQFDDARFRVQEDPRLHEYGHENDAVIIEVPDNRPGYEQDATALQMFARAVPPDQQDWITKSATVVSHAISTTTNLLLTTVTMASNYYVSHSTPSPHHSKSNPASGAGTPAPQPPPRALVFLTSEQTRKGLAGVHAVSGQAVKVSTKTVTAVDNMIRRAMGSKPKQRRFLPPEPPSNIPGAGPSYPTYPTDKGPVGPPMHPRASSFGGSNSYLTAPPAYPGPPPPLGAYPGDNKPPVPPRARSTSPGLPPMPPPTMQGPPPGSTGGFLPPQPGPRPPLSTRERVVLSADLILSTIDHETRRILNGGTETIGHVVGHKYGPEAAESSVLMAGTAKNVALVYVDMRGMGRRALLRAAGTQFVKGQLSGNPPPLPKR